jgi:hypothetical protein
MNSFEQTAMALEIAEKALKETNTLTKKHIAAKGNTMLEQVVNYIADTLADAHYMLGEARYGNIDLIGNGTNFYLRVGNYVQYNSPIKVCIFERDGSVNYMADELPTEWIVSLARDWAGFKQTLDEKIEFHMEEHIKKNKAKLAKLEQERALIDNWHI